MKKILTLFLSLLLCITIFPRGIVAEESNSITPECIDLKDYYYIDEFDASALLAYKDVFGTFLPLIDENVCLAYLAYKNMTGVSFADVLGMLKTFGLDISNLVIENSNIVEMVLEFLEHYPIEQLRMREIVATLYNIARNSLTSEQSEQEPIEEGPSFSPADFIPEYDEDNKMSLFDAFFAERLADYLLNNISIIDYLTDCYEWLMKDELKIETFEQLIFFYEDPFLYCQIFDLSLNYSYWHNTLFDYYLPDGFDDYRVGDLISIYVSMNKVISRIQYEGYLFDFSSGTIVEDNIDPGFMLMSISDYKRSDITIPNPDKPESRALLNFLRSKYVTDENIAYTIADIDINSLYIGGMWMDDVLRCFLDYYYRLGEMYTTIDEEVIHYNPYLYMLSYEDCYNFFLSIGKFLEKYQPSTEEIYQIISNINDFDDIEELFDISTKDIQKRCVANDLTFSEWFASASMFLFAFSSSFEWYDDDFRLMGSMASIERFLSDIDYDEYFTFDMISAYFGVLNKGYSPNVKATCIKNVTVQDLLNYKEGELNDLLKYSLFNSFDDDTLMAFATYLSDPAGHDDLKGMLSNAIGTDGTYDLINGKADKGDGTIIIDGIHYQTRNLEDETVAVVDNIIVKHNDETASLNYDFIKNNISNLKIDEQIIYDDWYQYALSMMTGGKPDISSNISAFFELLYNMRLATTGLGGKEESFLLLYEKIFDDQIDSFMTIYNSSVFFAYGLYLLYTSTYLPFNPVIPYISTFTNLTPSEAVGTYLVISEAGGSNYISDLSLYLERYDISLDKLIKFFDDNTEMLGFIMQEVTEDATRKMLENYGPEYATLDNAEIFSYALTDKDWFINPLKYIYCNDFRLDLINLMVYPTLESSDNDVVIPDFIPNTDIPVVAVNYGVGSDDSYITSLTLPSTMIALAPTAFVGVNLSKLDFYSTTNFVEGALNNASIGCVNINEIQENESVITTSLLIPENVEGYIKVNYDDESNLIFIASEGSVWELPIQEETSFTIEELLNKSSFEILIPDKIEFGSTGSKEFTIKSKDLFLSKIASGVGLKIVSSQNDFKVKCGDNAITYSIDKYDKDTGTVYKFVTPGDEDLPITASIIGDIKYAGEYLDKLTFSYALEGLDAN